MLQTLKSTIVLGTLLVVGYGVHVMLNRPPGGFPDTVWNDSADVDLPEIDFGEDPLDRPTTSLAEATASETAPPQGPLDGFTASVPSSPISNDESNPGGVSGPNVDLAGPSPRAGLVSAAPYANAVPQTAPSTGEFHRP